MDPPVDTCDAAAHAAHDSTARRGTLVEHAGAVRSIAGPRDGVQVSEKPFERCLVAMNRRWQKTA
jgi:hypothetical protein